MSASKVKVRLIDRMSRTVAEGQLHSSDVIEANILVRNGIEYVYHTVSNRTFVYREYKGAAPYVITEF